MRADLHREYKHPTTGLVARLTDIAKEFNLSPPEASRRLKKRLPLTTPARPYRHKGSKHKAAIAEPPKRTARKIKALPKIFIQPKLGVNPITGSLQNKYELSAAFGITVKSANNAILAGRTGKIRFHTEGEKLVKLTKKKAAQAEMNKLIVEMDARKAMMNVRG